MENQLISISAIFELPFPSAMLNEKFVPETFNEAFIQLTGYRLSRLKREIKKGSGFFDLFSLSDNQKKRICSDCIQNKNEKLS